MRAIFSILLIIPLFISCRDREEVLAKKLDGTWIMTSVIVDREASADSIVTSNLGKLIFESCKKEQNPCKGEMLLDSGQRHEFEFQTSNPKDSFKTVIITFLPMEQEDQKKYSWSGTYEIGALGEELVLSCQGCVTASRNGGTKFEIRAKRP